MNTLNRSLFLVALLVVASLSVGASATGQSILNVNVNKERDEYAIWFYKLSFNIRVTAKAKPPRPTFTIDLFDEDDIGGDDAVDVDLTETSGTVTVSAWKQLGNTAIPGVSNWECLVNTGGVQEQDVTDPLPWDFPDPRVEIVVTVGKGTISLEVCAPDLPAVGVADFGIDSPSAIANVGMLAGEQIAALSRGFDDISLLRPPTLLFTRVRRAALYFACEHHPVAPASDTGSGPGRIFILDAAGDLWPEDLYAANYDPTEAVLGPPRYLNVNTAGSGSQVPTDEIYFVREGTDEVLYSPNGDPAAAFLYLDISAPQGVTALAVEDLAPRGLWGPGDRVLYALEDSAAIHSWAYGGVPTFLSLQGATFDGSTEIGFDHFDRDLPRHSSLKVGNIRALAVSSPGRETPEPSGRVVPEVVDHNGLFTYGLADGGRIGFDNNPVLGATDFQVTLRDVDPGMWAMLYMGSPIAAPGVSLPPSVSSSLLLLDPSSMVPVYSASQTVGGATTRTLPIPTTPGLAGAVFGLQWVVFMPLTLPVTLSDAGVVQLR